MEKTDKAFFYGTLMAPQVLNRVCYGTTQPEPWQRDRISIQPALLRGYCRHRVRYADYPAIVPVKPSEPSSSSPSAHGSTLSPLDLTRTVRGTLVSGLTDADFTRLDLFEGSMYKRVMVDVQTQEGGGGRTVADKKERVKEVKKKINAAMYDSHVDDDSFNGETVKVQTYVWADSLDELEPKEWNFEHFVKERLVIWAGTSGKEDFEEVDKAVRDAGDKEGSDEHDSTGGRGVNGAISKKLEEEPVQAKKIFRSAV